MLDAFESPQEFCVVTEFAQVCRDVAIEMVVSLMPTTTEIAITQRYIITCFFLFQGELFEVLEDDKCLPEEQVQAIAKQLVIFYHSESSDALISKMILHILSMIYYFR